MIHVIRYMDYGYRVNAGVVCWQLTLCDLHLSTLEVRFSRRCAIQIDVYLYLTFIETKTEMILRTGISLPLLLFILLHILIRLI